MAPNMIIISSEFRRI